MPSNRLQPAPFPARSEVDSPSRRIGEARDVVKRDSRNARVAKLGKRVRPTNRRGASIHALIPLLRCFVDFGGHSICGERKAHVRGLLTIYDYAKQKYASGGQRLRQTGG
jgi:hypothetical protein